MHIFGSRPLLLLLLAALRLPAGALAVGLAYKLPEELLALFSPDDSSSSSSSSSCTYPVNYTLTNFSTFAPHNATSNSTASYVSFTFTDEGTQISTPCAYNASSTSLTAGTRYAARYACDNSLVSFVWQRGEATLIEVTCPGQTSTVYEASGSVEPSGLQCSYSTNGTLCTTATPLTAVFTSDEPSPVQSTTTRKMRRVRRHLPVV